MSDESLCARLRDHTAPEYIDGRPTGSELDYLLMDAAARIEELGAELAEWRKAWRGMEQRAERAEAELAEARRDVERYRWLREQGIRNADLCWLGRREKLDACIDAAIAGSKS